MRLREVFRYEVEHRLRRPTTWILMGFQGLLTLWVMFATYEDGSEFFNAPIRLAGGAAIAGMAGILISAALFGDAALRDGEAEMDPLLFTSGLRKFEYLGGRFLAALFVNALVLLAIPLAQMGAAQVPLLKPEELAPFILTAYLQPFLLLLLPNLVLIGSILFAIAALARQTIPVYLGAIGFFVAYIGAANGLEGVRSPVLLALGDPLGIGVLERATKYWTPAESNTRLMGIPAVLVLNRVVWLTIATAVLAVLHRGFRFAHHDGRRRRKDRRTVAAPRVAHAPPVVVPRAEGTFGSRTSVRQALAVARHSLREIALSRVFLACLLVAAGLALLFGWNVGDTMFDTSTWPVTYLVAEEVMTSRISPIIVLLIALFAGEMVWKDRSTGAAELTDAAPVPVSAMLAGRFLALVAMLATLQAAFMAAGVLLQTLQGYTRFELGLYLKILFGMSLIHWALIAALAMVVHVIVNQKYLGHVVVMAAYAFTMVPQMFRIHHHLLIYGSDPGWIYSDMNGFGPYLTSFVSFKLYWAAWALLLGVLANLLWVRGREPGLRRRLRGARARFVGGVAGAAGVAALLIAVLGGFVFYNTNVLNDYRSPDEAGAPQAEYERRYKRFEAAPQPTIESARLSVELHPERPAVEVRGTYRMVNRTGVAIDSVHVMFVNPEMRADSIAFDRSASPVLVDDERHFRIYALERPLEPGDAIALTFEVSFRPRGFRNNQLQNDVVRNGTVVNRSWLPVIGYQPVFELPDDEVRRRFGLEPKTAPAPDDDGARRVRWHLRNEDLVTLDATVGTSAGQTAIAPGVLRRRWEANGRQYFHYVTERPTLFGADIFSAEYSVVEDRWNDVQLQIYHHPRHRSNLDRTMRSLKASLEYLTQQFGPYPYSQLRVVEVPRYGGFGRAMPYTITFTEDYFQSRVKNGEVDLPFYGTAHEVAHAWWGGQLRGAYVRGHGLLSESLANYSAMMLTERTFGLEAARKIYGFQMERYLRGRAEQSREVPALDVEDQPYIAYRKGALALYTLREFLGESAVNTALRRYADRFRDAGPPYPTSRDLYAELRAMTPDSLRTLLEDWFEKVMLSEVRLSRAVFEPTESGEFAVTIDVTARKGRADSLGAITEVPMDDLVEIGVFAPGNGEGLGEPLYLKRHRIRSGKQTIRVIVPREPAHAGIDPYHKLIDRERSDNVFTLRRAGE